MKCGDRGHMTATGAPCGQTISAPLIVGIMTSALAVAPEHRVLEIGTGTGYQSAVLARLAAQVFTIDRFRPLVAAAESRFKTLRLSNVIVRVGDGTAGWPEQAPFDRIVVTAAAEDVPQALTAQLPVGGVLVMPVQALGGTAAEPERRRGRRIGSVGSEEGPATRALLCRGAWSTMDESGSPCPSCCRNH